MVAIPQMNRIVHLLSYFTTCLPFLPSVHFPDVFFNEMAVRLLLSAAQIWEWCRLEACIRGTFLVHIFCMYRNFVEEKLGSKFMERRRTDLAKSHEESSPATYVFFILSPEVEPFEDIETLSNLLICFWCKDHSTVLPLKKEKLTSKVKWSMQS